MGRHLWLKFGLLSLLMAASCSWASADNKPETEAIARPGITNSSWEEKVVSPVVYRDPYAVALFNAPHGEDRERLNSQSLLVGGFIVTTAGVLALLPSDFTQWEDSEEPLHKRWWDNVRAGPTWDRDEWYLNWLGHPYLGGMFYQVARKSGYRQWDAFIYNTLMSTFAWEYGVEAFAEVPSIQDLVMTPLLGWVYGEWAFQKEREIIQRGRTVWGSRFLGNTALLFLDPIDALGWQVNNLFGRKIFIAGTGYWGYQEAPLADGRSDEQVYLQLHYRLGSGKPQTGDQYLPSSAYSTHSKDPVDYSIVSFSLGSSYLNLDDLWLANNAWAPTYTFGIHFYPSLSARLSYTRTKLDSKRGGGEFIYENYSADLQYYFLSEHRIRPFVTVGFGETLLEEDLEQNTFQWNGGIGLHLKLSNKWAFQFDWRSFYGKQNSSHDALFTGQLIYRFGRGEYGAL
ncbi:DUF3943 domain-containing protein [Ferrimonas balearica]|uniref:DUF3943 domain-containing protein n=1 Tax=Ferrimonas balearica TaxID=44012 RepID=UPI001C9926BA|nr:DUF3943 domain-containing protein [Ferrimonas balearica]MBY5920139.1 DUF3943 domain-containing protein [Ferrimonas balearica]MBY5997176.1 DUF3943 domain-containing protein [Ferrimonas balearica]